MPPTGTAGFERGLVDRRGRITTETEGAVPDFSFLNDDEPNDGTIRINTGPTRKPAKPKALPAKKSEPSTAAGCLLALLLFGGCYYVMFGGTTKRDEQFEAEWERSLAVTKAQSYVKKHLKAPRSAKWPVLADGGFGANHATKLADGTYMVRSFVDAQNEFGAMIRTWYVVRLRMHQDGRADILEAVWE